MLCHNLPYCAVIYLSPLIAYVVTVSAHLAGSDVDTVLSTLLGGQAFI